MPGALRLTMKQFAIVAIIGLAPVLTIAVSAEEPTDHYLPSKIGGEVNDESSNFVYASDVENESDSQVQ